MGLLDRVLGRAKAETSNAGATPPAAPEKIIQEYRAVLSAAVPTPDCVADIRQLPHSKEQIKRALIFKLRITGLQMREQLQSDYILLANWQEGVGDRSGPDLKKTGTVELARRIVELAKRVASQHAASVTGVAKVKAEQEALKAELQILGLW